MTLKKIGTIRAMKTKWNIWNIVKTGSKERLELNEILTGEASGADTIALVDLAVSKSIIPDNNQNLKFKMEIH